MELLTSNTWLWMAVLGTVVMIASLVLVWAQAISSFGVLGVVVGTLATGLVVGGTMVLWDVAADTHYTPAEQVEKHTQYIGHLLDTFTATAEAVAMPLTLPSKQPT